MRIAKKRFGINLGVDSDDGSSVNAGHVLVSEDDLKIVRWTNLTSSPDSIDDVARLAKVGATVLRLVDRIIQSRSHGMSATP